jgi:hypothetical protein
VPPQLVDAITHVPELQINPPQHSSLEWQCPDIGVQHWPAWQSNPAQQS